jgi:hypothetical protein
VQRAVATTIATTTSPAALLKHQTAKNFYSVRPNCKTPGLDNDFSNCAFSKWTVAFDIFLAIKCGLRFFER